MLSDVTWMALHAAASMTRAFAATVAFAAAPALKPSVNVSDPLKVTVFAEKSPETSGAAVVEMSMANTSLAVAVAPASYPRKMEAVLRPPALLKPSITC